MMKAVCIIYVIVLLAVTPCTSLRRSYKAGAQVNNPVADPKAVVVIGNARFTVLTERMIRIEWAADKVFEDRATFAVVNRLLPVPKFTVSNTSDSFTISTAFLTLAYENSNASPAFTPSNLAITLLGLDQIKTTWSPNATNTGNLLGTIRTLDGVNGAIELDCVKQSRDDLHCTYGLVSKSGWDLVDETNRPAFDTVNDPQWKWFSPRTANKIDWYFLGHGLNFEQALMDYTLIGGNIPLPPRFAFGIWWSRYWAYSDIEFMGIVEQYEMHKVPLDVLVIDMDWHITFYKEASKGQRDQAGQTPGWTGFTWDANLFPNPSVFLKWVQSKGLKSTLNLHPASGVQPHELRYPQMALSAGIDPASKKYVPFALTNQTFTETFHDIMLKPLEDQGINFWWLDWQQGETFFNIPGINPTFLLNYVFFTNPHAWANGKRPMLFHRWGGLGDHRYQIGFTGDVVPSWASLNFQVYFTATAANVMYGFWSHDIGGHTEPSPAELYTRWIQWGCFAPVLRTHCTKSPINERRIWAYPLTNFFIMRDAMVLRAALVPYTYTAARIAHDTGIAMLRGLYYSWPTHDEAYNTKTEYIFGDDMVVMPVTSPVDATGLVQQSVWIPPGQWIEWFSGLVFTGPQTVVRQFALDDIPVYVRAGSIIPLESPEHRTQLVGGTQNLPTTLTFVVFITSSVTSGETSVYEDEGNTNNYDDNQHSTWTKATYSFDPSRNAVTVAVGPVEGTFPGLPSVRNYKIVINNVYAPRGFIVDGGDIVSDSYNGDMLAQEVVVANVSVRKGMRIDVFVQLLNATLPSGLPLAFRRMATVKTLLDNQWGTGSVWQEDYEHVILAASAGQRMTYNPLQDEITQYSALYTAALNEVKAMTSLSPAVKAQAVALLTTAQPTNAHAPIAMHVA